jgi:YbgC/YbaW family acyl-CoA thioester hydrolase
MKTNIEVRFTDVDSQLHVNHTAIVEYIAHCRVQLLRPIEDWEEHGVLAPNYTRPQHDHVLVHLAVNLCEPLHYPADVVVTGQIVEIGHKSVTTRYLVHSGKRLISDAECINVVVDVGTTTSVTIPPGLHDLLTAQSDIPPAHGGNE